MHLSVTHACGHDTICIIRRIWFAWNRDCGLTNTDQSAQCISPSSLTVDGNTIKRNHSAELSVQKGHHLKAFHEGFSANYRLGFWETDFRMFCGIQGREKIRYAGSLQFQPSLFGTINFSPTCPGCGCSLTASYAQTKKRTKNGEDRRQNSKLRNYIEEKRFRM